MPLTYGWLAIILVILVAIVIAFPLHYLILFDLQTFIFKDFWSLGGVRADQTDLVIGFLVLALLVRGRPKDAGPKLEMPFLFAWLMLGVWWSISYVSVPVNQPNLTDPIRIAYQLYRYCWKPLLYFPICFLFLRTPGRIQLFFNALILGTNLTSLQCIYQGYTGQDPRGPYGSGNAFAGTAVIPLTLAFASLMFPTSRRQMVYSAVSFVIIARAVMMSGSRGGALACAASCGCFVAGMLLLRIGRKRVLQFVPIVLLIPPLLFLWKPDLLERPHVKRLLTVSEGTEVDNLEWRVQQRWPHFWARAWEHPWVGWGSDVDDSLGKEANTPHNGYLSIAVRYGFPVLVCFLYLAARFLLATARRYFAAREERGKIFYLTLAAPIAGMLVHNVAEVTWTDYPVLKGFWMLMAILALEVVKRGKDPQDEQDLENEKGSEEEAEAGG